MATATYYPWNRYINGITSIKIEKGITRFGGGERN